MTGSCERCGCGLEVHTASMDCRACKQAGRPHECGVHTLYWQRLYTPQPAPQLTLDGIQ